MRITCGDLVLIIEGVPLSVYFITCEHLLIVEERKE